MPIFYWKTGGKSPPFRRIPTYSANTAYINTIPPGKEERSPGDHALEHRIRSYIRWNAMAMVLRANRHTNVGGHIASFASAATLYDVGYNHFWRAANEHQGGDLVYVQAILLPVSMHVLSCWMN